MENVVPVTLAFNSLKGSLGVVGSADSLPYLMDWELSKALR